MKKINFLYSIILLVVIVTGCSKDGIDDDISFVNSAGSGNLSGIFKISDDNSGRVWITPLGEGVTTSTVYYGEGSDSAVLLPANTAVHSYPEGSYTVTIASYDLKGTRTATEYPLTVTYRAPENVELNIGADVAISATALYANSFLVYYGDVANEVGTPLATGATLPAHIYPAGGPYDMRLIAESGGAATTVITKTMFGFPLSFESPTMDYFFGTFGNVVFNKVANPSISGMNTSATVGKYEKPAGAETWSGTYSPLNIPINLAYGHKVKMLVYNPDPLNIGKLVNCELESEVAGTGGVPNGQAVIKVAFTTSGAWEELTFDYTTLPAIGASARFNQLVLRYDDVAPGAGQFFYVDDIRITN